MYVALFVLVDAAPLHPKSSRDEIILVLRYEGFSTHGFPLFYVCAKNRFCFVRCLESSLSNSKSFEKEWCTPLVLSWHALSLPPTHATVMAHLSVVGARLSVEKSVEDIRA